jgi:hypothetical protein
MPYVFLVEPGVNISGEGHKLSLEDVWACRVLDVDWDYRSPVLVSNATLNLTDVGRLICPELRDLVMV